MTARGSSLAFVHLGPALPGHLGDALRQARAFATCPIHLVAEAAALAAAPPDPALGVTAVAIEDLGVGERHAAFRGSSRLDRGFRDGFWTYTTERFFVLETLMARLGLEHVIHLENDNLLYVDAAELAERMAARYPGLAGTFDNDGRCVPGILYLRDAAAAARLSAFLLEVLAAPPAGGVNDMTLLGLFRRAGPQAIGHLPIVTPDYPEPLRSIAGDVPARPEDYWEHAEAFGGVFDAAALGQYLGGVDPRNGGGDTRGFVNESCVFDPRRYRFATARDERGRRLFFLAQGSTMWRINSLHIHSKNLAAFASLDA